jgi:molybdopterin converting factor small subunit
LTPDKPLAIYATQTKTSVINGNIEYFKDFKMGVKVKLCSIMRQSANWQEIVEIDKYTPKECLKELEDEFPDIRRWIYDKHGNMLSRLQLYINGEIIYDDEMTRALKDDDELFVLLNIGGG